MLTYLDFEKPIAELETRVAVTDRYHRGRGTSLRDLAGVQLLAWRRRVDPHAATLLTFAAA